jgi:hypothetical protein
MAKYYRRYTIITHYFNGTPIALAIIKPFQFGLKLADL